ncbi:MAG: hypothetical protein C4541_04175 [Candidatus Auribacter fodinae]|uniref:Uncharacterized protein n=1 Tax=Candidatus Auribacter fodinae TaxID=2093366 RepID=A0A3A4RFA4_9BACT|nr:MAG: hypothetical protein C4541_04175 [Candidatus Auribacter fodinae]
MLTILPVVKIKKSSCRFLLFFYILVYYNYYDVAQVIKNQDDYLHSLKKCDGFWNKLHKIQSIIFN